MLSQAVISLIKLYQKTLSPIIPGKCKYYPSCSTYAIISIQKYGLLSGSIKALWRILRCNPMSKGGIDYP